MSFRSLIVSAAMIFSICCSSASAADTWLPDYHRETKIYVDPALANHATDPVKFDSDFAQKLQEQAQKHNLDIYVIATQQADDLTGESRRWAPDLLHTPLWNKWSSAGSFQERDVLILLWVRFKDDTSKNSIAARAGSRLHSYGISRQHLFNPNGPVLTAIRANIPGNPQGALLGIAENINNEIDAYQAKNSSAPAVGSSDNGTGGGGGLVLMIVIAVVIAGVVAIVVAANRSSSTSSSSYYSSPSSSSTPTSGGSSTAANVGGAIAGGVLGGLAASALTPSEAEKATKRKKDDSGSSGSDTSSTTSSSSCSSAPASSCSSCGSSSCGGGGGCGGGGCGGGGCGGG